VGRESPHRRANPALILHGGWIVVDVAASLLLLWNGSACVPATPRRDDDLLPASYQTWWCLRMVRGGGRGQQVGTIAEQTWISFGSAQTSLDQA